MFDMFKIEVLDHEETKRENGQRTYETVLEHQGTSSRAHTTYNGREVETEIFPEKRDRSYEIRLGLKDGADMSSKDIEEFIVASLVGLIREGEL